MENLLGGLDKLEAKLERARKGESGGSSNALATFEITRPLVGASALGIARAAYEWTLDWLEGKSEGFDGSDPGRCSSSSASSRCWPTWRPRSTPPACSCSAPPGWAATACR